MDRPNRLALLKGVADETLPVLLKYFLYNAAATAVAIFSWMAVENMQPLEIGYSVVPAFAGQGLATEIVRALVDHAFAAGQVRRILAHTTAGNCGSAKVLDHAGFAFVGPGRDEGTVEYVMPYPQQEEK